MAHREPPIRLAVRRPRAMTLVYVVLALIPLFAIISFAVDYGRVQSAKTGLQSAVTAAARAGASGLTESPAEVRARAASIFALNTSDSLPSSLNTQTEVQIGFYDRDTKAFTALTDGQFGDANAVKITVHLNGNRGVPLLFATAIGLERCSISATSTCMSGNGETPSYIGMSLTRMYNDTRVDGYNAAAGSYGGVNIRSDQTIYGADNFLLDANAYVYGKAKYGPTGTLTKDSTATVTGGITRNSEQIAFAEMPLGNAGTVNNNSQLGSYFNSSKRDFKVVGNKTSVTLPGGTYYINKLEVGKGATVRFSGKTTIYLTGDSKIEGSLAHTSLKPSQLKINGIGGPKVEIKSTGTFYGHIFNPLGDVHHHDDGQSFGSVISDLLCFRHNAQGHADASSPVKGGVMMVK